MGRLEEHSALVGGSQGRFACSRNCMGLPVCTALHWWGEWRQDWFACSRGGEADIVCGVAHVQRCISCMRPTSKVAFINLAAQCTLALTSLVLHSLFRVMF